MNHYLHIRWPVLALVGLFPLSAAAHTGVGLTTGFGAGFNHPMLGTDHLLAMVAVGLLAVQMGAKAIWVLPGAFVSLMVVGGGLAIAGVHIPYVEAGILASVLVLGLLVAAAFRLPMAVSAIIVGVFALFHGHAHGAEMPLASGAVSYSLGFALATALLHLAGITGAMTLQKANMGTAVRIAGGAIACSGIYLAVA